ncbi:MAG: cryptochrome/photolyase family protein [Bacteroidia bacterium]
MPHTLRLVLGDQLDAAHPWFGQVDAEVVYVMMEVKQETGYVLHHVQKVVAFFAAMRDFADRLQAAGHRLHYLRLDDPDNRQTIPANLDWLIATYGVRHFAYLLPDEYRLDAQLAAYAQTCGCTWEAVDTTHFLTRRDELAVFFRGKKTYLMESFYRHMRKRYRVLVEDDGSPVSGQWNYDADNRRRYDGRVPVPPPYTSPRDVSDLVAMLRDAGVATFGQIDAARFGWPVTRTEALAALDHFVEACLPFFGTYQDALSSQHGFLFHARLSFVLNVKLLHPMEVVQRAVDAWTADPVRVGLAQVEGFVRQIIGWREYMRGVYWAQMPGYDQCNYFGHDRPLPTWYWTGETHMRCLRQTISHSLDHAYAHHIQRLMVTGNFALLAGIDPTAVDAWYLGIYIDAIEWVEITNTRGMSQYADGGLVASKPYVSSANYLDNMSDYCAGCRYDPRKRHGADACPFNSLYWHFYERHRGKLATHPRIGFAYKTLDRMAPGEKAQTLAQAEAYLARLDTL